MAPLESTNRAKKHHTMSRNHDFSARGTHTSGNPPAGSPAAWALDVQAQNSLTVKTGVGNQGPGGSKLLVEDTLSRVSSSGSISQSMESLLLDDVEVRSEESTMVAPAAAGLEETGAAQRHHSVPTHTPSASVMMVNPGANQESAIVTVAEDYAPGLGVRVVEANADAAVAVTRTAPMAAQPLFTGSAVNSGTHPEGAAEPMETDAVPPSGVSLSKRQMKRVRRRLAKAAEGGETSAVSGVVGMVEASVGTIFGPHDAAEVATTSAAAARALASSTPVAEAVKRNRSDNNSSDMALLTADAPVGAPTKKRRTKKRKANQPDTGVVIPGQAVKAATGRGETRGRPIGHSGSMPASVSSVVAAVAPKIIVAVAPGEATGGRPAGTKDGQPTVCRSGGMSAGNARNGAASNPPNTASGNQSASASGDYAQVAASAMTIEICGDGGQCQLTQREIDFVDSRVWEAIGISKEIPRFECMRTEHGIIQVQCSNSYSLEWLTKIVAEIPVFEGRKFVTRRVDRLQRLVRASMLIPGPPREPHAIIARLRAQNEGLDTTHWRTYQYARSGTDPRFGNASHLVIGIDPEALKVIRTRYGMRLYFNLGRVLVTILGSDTGKANKK